MSFVRQSAYKILACLSRRNGMTEGVPVLLYGAGRRGKSVLQELKDNRALGLHPVGFLDDDPDLTGSTINRVRILGSSHDLDSILNSQKISALIISSHKISAERLASVMSLCSEHRIPLLRGEFQLDRISGVLRPDTCESSEHEQQIGSAPHRSSPKVNVLPR